LPVNQPQVAAGPDTITDDVIEISPEIDNQQPADDELERYVNNNKKNFEN
jgi:hypothetical protein